MEKPLRARGTRLGTDGAFERQGVTPEGWDLLLVPRDPGAAWFDFGPVQVELRPVDPSLSDEPGWWLSGDGDYEVRRPKSGWSRLSWRRALNAVTMIFPIGVLTAAVGLGGAARHLSFPGTPTWPAGSVVALIGGVLAVASAVVAIRAVRVPRVYPRATLVLGLMTIALFVCAVLGFFIATYGDPT